MTTSVEDRIQAELWRGAIPVEIHLAADEVADVRAPPPFFGLIPRGAYLPVWHDRETEPSPRRHFEPFVARFPDDKGTARAIADAVGDEVRGRGAVLLARVAELGRLRRVDGVEADLQSFFRELELASFRAALRPPAAAREVGEVLGARVLLLRIAHRFCWR